MAYDSTDVPQTLAGWILQSSAGLTAMARRNGLAAARPRSAPDRVASEARSFVRLLAVAASPAAPLLLAGQLEEAARIGCFAAALGSELPAFFRVWRRSITALAGRGRRGRETCRVLRSLQVRAGVEVGRGIAQVDVVLLGGSAGGIDAIARILERLDRSLPVTVLVVLHVGAASRLTEVLTIRSAIPVTIARDGGPLLLGQVFVAPPGRHLAVRKRRVRLDDQPQVHYSRPSIDVLFSTASRDLHGRVLAIVVSGTGQDGLEGARAVRHAGGTVVAQDPRTAQFPAMPQSVVTAGAADGVLGPEAIAALVSSLASARPAALRSSRGRRRRT
jgi:two-component system chemotaxis response regulator CheB